MKAEAENPDQEKSIVQKPIKKSRARWLFFIFSFIIFFLIISYGLLAYAAQTRVLPLTKYLGQDIGLQTFSQVTKTVLQSDKQIKKTSIQLSLDGKVETKTLDELGFSIQSSKTVDSIFNFGKKKFYIPLPSFSYFKSIYSSNTQIPVSVRYSSDTEKKLGEIFPDSKKDAVNASIKIENGKLEIVNESNGSKADINDLAKKVENKLNGSLLGQVQIKKIQSSSNFNSKDVEVFKSDIENLVNRQLTLQSNYKKIIVKKENLLSFVDLERTILNQKLTLSDQSITDYLNNDIAKSFNIAGKSKEISTVDNSVIYEGQEGQQLDVSKSMQNIKNALDNNQKIVTLVMTTSPIKEEFISPGYNVGKYPGKYIEVNLTHQMLYTIDGTQLVNSYKVSTGKWSMPTPIGDYVINNKDPRAYSSKYGLYMPYWMAFIGSEYGIHELPEWPDGRKEGESHLGTPVSHGCVRLGRGSAEEVYNWSEIGTPIFIHK